MNKVKDDKGITNMTLITIALAIIILMLLVVVIYLVKNSNTTYITQNLPTQQSVSNLSKVEIEQENIQLSNVETNKVDNENKYEKIKGEYYGINNVYYDSAEAEIPCEYKLYLKEDGTFDYNVIFDNHSGFCGNYIINDSEIILNKLFQYGSDVSLTAVEGQVKLKINQDGTITDSNKYYEEFSVKDIILTRRTTEITESLKLHIDSAIRDNAISAGN